ncbi:MAG: hypothetical protein K940chlam7_01843 [Chlamydiae bacterium]|nr:hypothetical protein [Chlamydiota bacterium]
MKNRLCLVMANSIPSSSSTPSGSIPPREGRLAESLPSETEKSQFTITELDRTKSENLLQIADKIKMIAKNVKFVIGEDEIGRRITTGKDSWGQERQFILAHHTVDSASDVCGYLEYYEKGDAPYVAFIGVINAYDKEKKIPGVGTALMLRFVEHSREIGKEVIILECRETKEGKDYRLPQFYEKVAQRANCGFEKERVGYYRNGDPMLEITYLLKQDYQTT